MNPFLRQLTCAACVLLANAVGYAQQKPAAPLRGFSVVLVQGDQEGTSSELPATARAAINDVKDFLPFKSYRLLDSSWTLGSNTTQEFTSRLRGDNQDYEVRISSKPEDPASVGVKFVLRETGNASGWSSGRTHHTVGGDNTQSSSSTSSSSNSRQDWGSQAFNTGGWSTPYADFILPAPIIDTSFSMRVGETVVVGTSRVRGNKALIALLTAVPASGKDKE